MTNGIDKTGKEEESLMYGEGEGKFKKEGGVCDGEKMGGGEEWIGNFCVEGGGGLL